MPTHTSNGAPEPSKVEKAKTASRHLRGDIAKTIFDPGVENFSDDDYQLLKFHGVYQGFDRENKTITTKDGVKKKSWQYMIRIAVPGGRCSADQYLAVDDLASKYANGTIKLTTRQAFQLHCVGKGDLWATMHGINKALMTSLTACGDIPRNMMASPAPFADEVHRAVQKMARDLAQDLKPATGAYHEIWVEGEKVLTADHPSSAKHLNQNDAAGSATPNGNASATTEEPFYGDNYLPRKFKIGVAIDFDNSIDLYSYDTGLVAITEGEGRDVRLLGYNVLVGGGLGMTHNKPDTIARMATVVGFVKPEHGREVIKQVTAAFRDLGERSDRKHARLKYLVEAMGPEAFLAEVRERCDFTIEPPRPTKRPRQLDHMGRHDQGDGKQFLGVFVEGGRVQHKDARGADVRAAFRRIAEEIAPTFILTPMQSMILADMSPDQTDRAEQILADHGVMMSDQLTPARRWSMACVAMPTCGLAITEAERISPEVITEFEKTFADLGIDDTDITIRMTGCPNGCARPYNADIGLVGKKPGKYNVYVGGGLAGDRLADLFADSVPLGDVIPTLIPLLRRYADERQPAEHLGDFYRRAIATDRPERTLLTGKEEPTNALYSLEVLTQ